MRKDSIFTKKMTLWDFFTYFLVLNGLALVFYFSILLGTLCTLCLIIYFVQYRAALVIGIISGICTMSFIVGIITYFICIVFTRQKNKINIQEDILKELKELRKDKSSL